MAGNYLEFKRRIFVGLDEQRPGAEVPGLFGFFAKSSEGDLVGFGNRRSILVVGKIGENYSTGTVKVV